MTIEVVIHQKNQMEQVKLLFLDQIRVAVFVVRVLISLPLSTPVKNRSFVPVLRHN